MPIKEMNSYRKKKKVCVHEAMTVAIRQKLSQGVWSSGDRLPTESELSRTFSISIRSVRKGIDLLVEEGLVERRQGSGTYVRQGTRPKVLETAPVYRQTIAVVIPLAIRGYHPFYSEMFRGIREQLTLYGYNIFNSDFDQEGLTDRDVRAVNFDASAEAETLLQLPDLAGVIGGVPIVNALRPLLPQTVAYVTSTFTDELPSAVVDWEAEIKRAILLLEGQGVRRVWVCAEKYAQKPQLMTDCDITFSPLQDYCNASELLHAAYDEGLKRLAEEPFDAVIATSDFIAQGLLDACSRLNGKLEKQPRFVCFVSRESQINYPFPVTAFVADGFHKGQELARLMHLSLSDRTRAPSHITLTCQIEDYR